MKLNDKVKTLLVAMLVSVLGVGAIMATAANAEDQDWRRPRPEHVRRDRDHPREEEARRRPADRPNDDDRARRTRREDIPRRAGERDRPLRPEDRPQVHRRFPD